MPRKNRPIKYTRSSVTINNCDSKRRYNSEREAINTAEYQMLINQNLELAVYKCDMCFKWHLTRQTKQENHQ